MTATYSKAELINYCALVDRPHNDEVMELVKRAELLPKIIRPLACAAVTFLLLSWFDGANAKAVAISAATGLATLAVSFVDETVMAIAIRKTATIAMIFAICGLFVGLAATLSYKQAPLVIVVAAVGGFGVAWIAARILLVVSSLLIRLVSTLLGALASPIAAPILTMVAASNRNALSTKYKEWSTSRGTPIIKFNREGLSGLNHDGEPIFLASSRYHAAGGALAAGIPLFTFSEIRRPEVINERMSAALNALQAGDAQQNFAGHPLMDINPATGLPMIAGIGSVDVAGNFFGQDHSHAHADIGMGHGSFDNY